MSAHYSTAVKALHYQPTIIESRLLINRLATQLALTANEIKNDPRRFAAVLLRDLVPTRKAILVVAAVGADLLTMMLLPGKTGRGNELQADRDDQLSEVTLMNLTPSTNSGGGSGPIQRASHGGGGGGDRNPAPPQTGKLPPPSNVLAAIPITPPVHSPTLPVAGIDIDPALWKDVKAPVYGDPKSTSDMPSKGPGEGDGIGTNKGLGIGDGSGPGYGPGEDGNTGGGKKQIGCCGSEPGSDRGPLKGSEVDQRARLLAKPEPQYTEEARRNQVSGTVMLRAIFSSSGDVVQIRALNTLPFGLTERAIAAARQIKFVPATKGGRPVSVYMQLEYNFNLY